MAGAVDSGSGTDVDLPIAPIIDCFVVLIAFLLVSAAYVSVSIFNADVAIVEESSNPSEVTATGVMAAIEVTEAGAFKILLTGDVSETIEIPKKDSMKEQKVELDTKLKEIKSRFADIKNITIKADSKVVYKTIVSAMEVARVYYPQILLGGF